MTVSSIRSFLQVFIVCLSSFLAVGTVLADTPIAAVNTENGLAIKGYDAVSYFDNGKPALGSVAFYTTYKGTIYRFTSAEHRDSFIATPEKFLPQYGGYCAFAIALDLIADIDPKDWAIVHNKLYLNNGFVAQTLWSLDKADNIMRGDENWPSVPKRENQ